tara:strand:- start:2630 stop:3835 length:1206 start_codon:yes stop_codon:yes gene_type:complete
LTAAGKVSDILIENTKAAAKEAMLAGSALVAAGQVAGEMGLDAITAYRERPRAPRNIEDLEISEDAMRYLESPESYGIPATQMRKGVAQLTDEGILSKARMTSEVTPGQTKLASLLGSQVISQKLQEDLDANEALINEFISRPEIDAEVAKRLKAAGEKPTPPSKMSSSYPNWVAKEKQIRSEVEKEIGVTGEDRAKYEALLGERQAILDEAAGFGIVLDNPPVRKNSSDDYFHARRLVKVLKERGNEMPDFDRGSAQSYADRYLRGEITDEEAHRMLRFMLEPYGLHTAAPSGYDEEQSAYLANPQQRRLRTITKQRPRYQMRQYSQLKCPRCGTTMGTEKARRRGCPKCKIKSPEEMRQLGKQFEASLKAQRLAAEQEEISKTKKKPLRRYNPGVSWYD